jgi:hypothetical protein
MVTRDGWRGVDPQRSRNRCGLFEMNALARAATEAGAQLRWLLQPDIGVRRRVARFWLILASGARYLDGTVQVIDPAAPAGTYGGTPAMVRAAVDGLGLSYSERQRARERDPLCRFLSRHRHRRTRIVRRSAACWRREGRA